VSDFIDLRGASGAAYRFRRADSESLPATAGNFVFVREDAGENEIVCCGTALSLASVSNLTRNMSERYGATDLYIRLNVARAVRLGEHEDIVGHAKPPTSFEELG
jgi:hypothetical protein